LKLEEVVCDRGDKPRPREIMGPMFIARRTIYPKEVEGDIDYFPFSVNNMVIYRVELVRSCKIK
jgi:hypothetical protein